MVGCSVTGAVVCLAGSMNLGISACWGAGPGVPEGPSPSPRRVVSSSGVGEVHNSSSTGLNREASITSSLLMVINGAMHCWSSLMALHKTPHLTPDAFAQVCSTLATASVFYCWMIWKFQGSEAGGRKSCGQSPCRVGRASHQPEASCCTSGSLKAAACHKVWCWAE